MGEIKSDTSLVSLIKVLHNREVQVRRAAVLTLSKYPLSQTESALKEALDDENWEVRMYAKAALNRSSDNERKSIEKTHVFLLDIYEFITYPF
ncbi:HEAT repeat domain-containing protein [candidate division KSB1 bacterium]|nr:HEAT repeat domain-containing protein [candidate division KSB1 bacterium]